MRTSAAKALGGDGLNRSAEALRHPKTDQDYAEALRYSNVGPQESVRGWSTDADLSG